MPDGFKRRPGDDIVEPLFAALPEQSEEGAAPASGGIELTGSGPGHGNRGSGSVSGFSRAGLFAVIGALVGTLAGAAYWLS